MPKVIYHNTYKLKKGASVPEFQLAVEKLIQHVSKEKGFISFQLLRDGDAWVDMSTWETMDDAKNFSNTGGPKELAEKFYSFLKFNSCKTHFYEFVQ